MRRSSTLRATLGFFIVLLFCLSTVGHPVPEGVAGPSLSPHGPQVVPTEVCACAPGTGAAGGQFRVQARGQPLTSPYDEQLGITFTQSFSSIEYNVTAVEQTDPLLGTGPAYLVNGLSDSGYWYQVGVSYDWSPGSDPGTGFDMNYEVFDGSGNSVFPSDGQGGVAAFSGTVHAGDTIVLDLYITRSTQTVTMLAKDAFTGASASETYPSMGSTDFVGLPNYVANSNGFFTGLMTEWYHGAPYFSNEAVVVYSDPQVAVSSAWLWMDEFNANDLQAVFSSNTSAPVAFGDPTKLQEFSYGGITEYADAYEFITGALGNSTGGPGSVPLIFSFEVRGGSSGSGFSSPVLNYVSNGKNLSVMLTGTPTAYNADNGTKWDVSTSLGGSVAGQRWETDQNASGVAISSETMVFIYTDQEQVTFGFVIEGNASGYGPPSISYTSFGTSLTTSAGVPVWADIGSRYAFTNPLPGSSAGERWYGSSSGLIGSSQSIRATYYLQYLVVFDVSFKDTEVFPSLALTSTSLGQPYSASLVDGVNKEWLDANASYSLPSSFSLEKGERLADDNSTTGTTMGVVSTNATVSLDYARQFYVMISSSSEEGGTVSPVSGWYDSGADLTLVATATPGWEFQDWQGSGSDSVSGTAPRLTMVVGPGAASNESAVFYPGVEIRSSGPSSVAYGDGSVSGTVQAGETSTVYVPLGTTLKLSVSNILPLFATFQGWTGTTSHSSGSSAVLVVTGPASVAAVTSYDYLGLSILVLGVVALGASGLWVFRYWHRRRPSGRSAVQGGSIPTDGSESGPSPSS